MQNEPPLIAGGVAGGDGGVSAKYRMQNAELYFTTPPLCKGRGTTFVVPRSEE